MIELIKDGVYLTDGENILTEAEYQARYGENNKAIHKKGTIAYGILESHNTSGDMDFLKIK